MRKSSESRFKAVGEYAGAVILCLLILFWVMKLWHADLTVPFSYSGDSLFYSMVIKGTLDNGWYLRNSFIGMPTGLEMYDFPLADNFHFLLIKVLSLFTSNYAVILNLFFLLTFPLTTLSSLYVFRQFHLSYLASTAASLLYTFLPYHFFRGENHLFYGAYYMVPMMVMIILWVYAGTLPLVKRGGSRGWLKLDLRSRKALASLGVCAVVGSSGVYYAFFGCFFLLVAGIGTLVRRKDISQLLTSLILTGTLSFVVFANVSPSLLYMYQHGGNEILRRGTGEAETYGLKIAQLLLPMTGHRVRTLQNLIDRYNSAPLITENSGSTLGFVGGCGFLVLIGWLLFKRGDEAHKKETDDLDGPLDHLSVLNGAAVLLATIGGFGSIFAVLISPQIRSYNRMSVYISFFSLFAIVLLLERFARSRVRQGWPQIAFHILIGVILLLGVLDQTSKYFVPPYATVKAEYQDNAAFTGRIEASVPPRSMIFQLPYVQFPESPAIHKMYDYEHFKAYIHSKTLRWSYGVMKGREDDLWQKEVTAQPLPKLVESLSLVGFKGIYINRKGYADHGAELETHLANLVGTKPLESGNGELAFFDLTEYNKNLRAGYTEKDLKAKQAAALHPVFLSWAGGFSGLEGTPADNWRWCSPAGKLMLNNTSQVERKLKLEMSLATGYEAPANLLIQSPLRSERLKINSKPTPYSTTIIVPPGQHILQFVCDAQRVNAPLDPRFLVFKVMNFRSEEIQ